MLHVGTTMKQEFECSARVDHQQVDPEISQYTILITAWQTHKVEAQQNRDIDTPLSPPCEMIIVRPRPIPREESSPLRRGVNPVRTCIRRTISSMTQTRVLRGHGLPLSIQGLLLLLVRAAGGCSGVRRTAHLAFPEQLTTHAL